MEGRILGAWGLTSVVVLVSVYSTIAQSDVSGRSNGVDDIDRAIQLAIGFSGFDKTLRDQTSQSASGKQLFTEMAEAELEPGDDGKEWRVSIGNIEIPWRGLEPSNLDTYRRDFDIFIDSGSGHLLRITSWRLDATNRSYATEDPRSLIASCTSPNSLFAGYTDSVAVPLIDVLARCPLAAHTASTICARYVLESVDESEDLRPRWVIFLYGIPPIPLFDRGATQHPEEYRTRAEVIYDVATDRLMVAAPHRGF